MPRACRFCLRAHKLVVTCPTGQVIFQYGHVLIFSAVYIIFTGFVQILAGHVKIFAGQVNFQNHVPDGHVNQMLNVKPWLTKHTPQHAQKGQGKWCLLGVHNLIYIVHLSWFQNWSVPWLLAVWLLAWPSNQQPWYIELGPLIMSVDETASHDQVAHKIGWLYIPLLF